MPRRLTATLFLLCLLSACAAAPARPRPYPPAGRPSGDNDLARESTLLRGRARDRFEEQKRRVERVGQRLIDTIPDHPKVELAIANGDPSINAGATFGQVAVTSGMLDFVRSDDELAVVLGHELAHIEQGHVLKGTIGGVALNVLAILLDTQVPGAGQLAGGVGQLFLNHFSQTQEREADEVGLRFAYQAGYDPRAAVDVQERLAVEAPQSMSSGYFDTHPSSIERAVAARRKAEELLAQGDPPGRSEVLARERADEAARYASQDRERPASREGPRFTASESEECRRAAVYAGMARDSKDPVESAELYRRARRYCPQFAEARGAVEPDSPPDVY